MIKVHPFRLAGSLLAACVALATSARAQLDADNATNSIFLIGYHTWWGADTVGYSFRNTAIFNPTANQNTNAPAETQALVTGTAIPDPTNVVYATPSLSATVSTPSGTQTFSASPGPGFSPGYASNNDSVILYHAKLINNLGVAALMPDLTNYSSDPMFASAVSYATTESSATAAYNTVQGGGANSVTPLTAFARLLYDLDGSGPYGSGVPALYVIPTIGALGGENDLVLKADGRSGFQHALMFAIDALKAHPTRAVKLGGKPLIVVYHGVIDVPNMITTSDQQAATVRAISGYDNFTLRHMSAMVNSKSELWANASPNVMAPGPSPQMYTKAKDGLWSWYDRVYSQDQGGGFAPYTPTPGGNGAVEMIAVPYTSWAEYYTPFLATRRGEQINYHMSRARLLHPKFVLMNQFNQFLNDTSGFTLDGSMNCEPTKDLDGTVHHELYDWVQSAIASYRTYEQGGGVARFTDISLRAQVGLGDATQIFSFTIGGSSTSTPQRVVLKGMGPSLAAFFAPGSANLASHPTFQLVDGVMDANSQWGFDARNEGYKSVIATTSYGVEAKSALANRTFANGVDYMNALNYGQAMSDNEPALTADLDPGSYSLFIHEKNYAGSSPGPMTHLRFVPSDLIGPNRITNFAIRAYVSSGTNCVIFQMKVDKTKNVLVSTLGPTLANYGLSPVLANPKLTLYDGSNNALQTWTGEQSHAVTLSPNVFYSIVLENPTGGGSGDGIAWFEVREN